MVKDKTKDGAVPGMVESKVNKTVRTKEKLSEKVRGIEFIVCFIGCPLAVWWIYRKYLGYCYGECCAYEWDGGFH